MALPIVTAPDPLPGDFADDRESDRRTLVAFVHTRNNASTRPVVVCSIGSQYLLVYDGTGFAPMFAGWSSVEQDSDEFTFEVIPAGGWWGEVEFFGWDGFPWNGQTGLGDDED